MTRDLGRLLRPGSIAVIGGGAWCAHVVENCRRFGFSGPVWPVHPDKAEIAGLPAFRDIADLPAAPDAAFVGVNRTASLGIVRALRDRGAGGAVVYASGFAEAQAETADGGDLQRALLQAAGDMVVIGPNCYGFVNYLDGAALWPDQQGGARVERGVAIITQSSNVAINLTMQRRGVPLAYVVTVGNQAQTNLAEIGRALLADPRVSALGLHIEGIGDIRALENLARTARKTGKPVVALKVGRSAGARAATMSHTASLAGSDAGGRALLARTGIARAHSLSGLLEALKLLHVAGPLASNRIASMSCSGGEAGLVADAAIGHDLVFPPLDVAQTAGLRAALGPRVALANPLDYHTYIWANTRAMTATFSAIMSAELALGVVVVDFPRADRCADSDWNPVVEAARRTMRATGRPMALLSSLPENMPEAVAHRLMRAGLVPLCGLEDGLEAIALAAWIGQQGGRGAAPVLLPGESRKPARIDEARGKAALAPFGLDLPAAHRVGDMKAVLQDADSIRFPVVLKGEGSAHKTEAGLVVPGLNSPRDLIGAARSMPATRFLVEEMIDDGIVELLVGVVRDPAHGMVLTLAAGGTLAELRDDRQSLLLPVERCDIDAALDRLRLAPQLAGYRGRPGVALAAIGDAVLAVQAFCQANPGRVEEIEINPLICTPTRAVAADVLIVMEET